MYPIPGLELAYNNPWTCGGAVVATAAGADLQVGNNNAWWNPTSEAFPAMKPGYMYELRVAAAAFTDLAGNPLAADVTRQWPV